jgi:hypothetical protein
MLLSLAGELAVQSQRCFSLEPVRESSSSIELLEPAVRSKLSQGALAGYLSNMWEPAHFKV